MGHGRLGGCGAAMPVAAVAARGSDGRVGIGECDGDRVVLGERSGALRRRRAAERAVARPTCDLNGDGQIAINEIIELLNAVAEQRDCSGEPCRATVSGTPFDCAQLEAAPRGGLAGGALAACFPGIDTDPLADTATCGRLGPQDGAAPERRNGPIQLATA